MAFDYAAKIAALMQLAEKAGTREEAQLAFAQAQKLRIKFAIEQAEIDLAKVAKGGIPEPIVSRQINVGTDRSIQRILEVVAYYNNCATLYLSSAYYDRADKIRHRADVIEIYGTESDIDFVEGLFASLLMVCQRQLTIAREAAPRYFRGKSAGYQFRIGFSDGITYKFYTAKKQAETESGTGTELVLQSVMARAQEERNKAVTCKPRKEIEVSHGVAWRSGVKAGTNADVSGGRNNLSDDRRALTS